MPMPAEQYRCRYHLSRRDAPGHSILIEIGSQNQSGCGITTQTADDRTWNTDVTVYTGETFDPPFALANHSGKVIHWPFRMVTGESTSALELR